MKPTKPLLLSALATPLLLALALPADQVRFAPAEGLTLTKSFTNTSSMSVEEMSIYMNGEDMSEMAGMDMDMDMTIAWTVTDEYAALGEGRPAKLVRSYDELGSSGTMVIDHPMQSMEQDITGASELEGHVVRFTWNDEDEEFEVAFDGDEEADEELLEGLEEDMDLRVLLPAGEVSEGDSWRIDLDEIVNMFAPGGDLKILPEEMGDVSMSMPGGDGLGMGDLANMFGEMDGSAIATYQGAREVEGVKVGVIALTIDITGANDITDILQQSADEMESPEMMGDMEIVYDSADVEFAIQGEGELQWNLSAGHLLGFSFQGDMETTMDMAMNMTMMGTDMEMEVSMQMSGTMGLEAKTRAGE